MHRSFEEYHSQRGRDHGQLRVFLPNPSRRRAKRDSQQTGTIHKLRRFRLGHYTRDLPFETTVCFRGGGVKNLPNLPTDSTIKLPTVGG